MVSLSGDRNTLGSIHHSCGRRFQTIVRNIDFPKVLTINDNITDGILDFHGWCSQMYSDMHILLVYQRRLWCLGVRHRRQLSVTFDYYYDDYIQWRVHKIALKTYTLW